MAAPSYFDPSKHNAPVYTFGVSRPKKIKDEHFPGPKYNIIKEIGQGKPAYVFSKSGMFQNSRKLKKSASLPGPGAYYNTKNHELSVSYSSSLLNSANIVIGKEKRFLDLSKEKTPGPGEYQMPNLITKTGFLYNSKYKSVPARSFLSSRNAGLRRKSDISPGPGQYNSFSIFEGYDRAKIFKK